MKLIQKEIGLEDITSRIPSLFPYIDFDIYGDSPIYNGITQRESQEVIPTYKDKKDTEGLGILHKATDSVQGSYGHVMGSFKMPNAVGFGLYDDAVMYYPVSYKEINDDTIITNREYNELSTFGRDCYRPYKYKNSNGDIVDEDAYNQLGEDCEKYGYFPSEYKNIHISDDVIETETYRNKTKRSKYNYTTYECSDGEKTIKFGNYNEDEKAIVFVSDRISGEIRVNNGNTVDSMSEVYSVALKKLIITHGQTYSYRTMMNAYYAHYKDKVQCDYANLEYYTPGSDVKYVDEERFVNKNDKTDIISYIDYHILEIEKQSFIRFIEHGIGRYTISECVEEYNQSGEQTTIPPTFDLINSEEISYEEYINSSFENIEDVYECIEYVKVSNQGENIYLYKNKMDGRLITVSDYNELNLYGSYSYQATTYQLNNGDTSDIDWYEIDEEKYSDLFFYGQSSYIPYQYIDSEFLTPTEYENLEDKEQYEPYSYINVNDSSNIITKSTYDSLKKNSTIASQYKVYRYVKVGYQLIFAYEYDLLLPEFKENYHIFSYTNTDKDNDILMVEEYDNLPKHGRMDYSAIWYAREGETTQISADDYYNLDDFGKEDYDISGYYNAIDTISNSDYINLKRPIQYKPYKYAPKGKISSINQQQYTALPKYGFKNYQPYQYYAILNTSSEGEAPRYQEYIITAEEYENETFIEGTKQDYGPYTYAPFDLVDGDNETDYIISYTDYYDIAYFGQIDYEEIPGSSIDNQINFEEDYENLFKDKDGNPIHESLKNICPSIINGVVYLAQIDAILSEMKKLRKSYILLINAGIDNNEEIRCNYSKYLRMGGDNMVLLLEWLKQKADEVANELMEYAIIHNSIKMPLTLSLTLQDNGYYTPAMNYKTDGMVVYPNEPFTYVDENGIADTYMYVGDEEKHSLVIDELTDSNVFKRLKDEVIQSMNNEGEGAYSFSLNGQLESKLKSLKLRKTYTNYMGLPETPPDGEDWLWYYIKGSIYDISMSVDKDGKLLPIDDGQANGDNVLAYGSVLTDIVANNDDCTITFTYYTDAHLKLVKSDTITNYRPYSDDLYEYYSKNYKNSNLHYSISSIDGTMEKTKEEYDALDADEKENYCIKIEYKESQFEIDTESDNGKYHGVKYTDTYSYERYGALYDLVERGSFEEYINSAQRGFEKYPFSSKANNVKTMAAGDRFVNIPYVSSDFEMNFDYRETVDNELFNFIYKEDLLNGIHYKPIIENKAFILRGTNAAFERHLRLGEVKTLEDLENYHNGSFFNIMNNF